MKKVLKENAGYTVAETKVNSEEMMQTAENTEELPDSEAEEVENLQDSEPEDAESLPDSEMSVLVEETLELLQSGRYQLELVETERSNVTEKLIKTHIILYIKAQRMGWSCLLLLMGKHNIMYEW